MAVTFTQANRLLAVTTPLGADALLLEKFSGTEGLSELFCYRLQTLAPADSTVKFEDLLGKSVTVKLLLPDNSARYFNGIAAAVEEGAQVPAARSGMVSFTRYYLEVVPKVWMLTRTFQSRIFQQMAIPDILKKVLTGLDVTWKLQGKYEPRDYCVQYRETDFAFASRLMEEEGIYYYFKHQDGSHSMVVADKPDGHDDVPGPTTLSYDASVGGLKKPDRVREWRKRQEVRSGKVTLWDYCFEQVGKNLEATKSASGTVSAGKTSHQMTAGDNTSLEIYDFPGLYAQRFDGIDATGGEQASEVQKIYQDNARTADIRLKREQANALHIDAEGDVRQLASGHKFTLDGHHDGNGSYVVKRIIHQGNLEGVYTVRDGGPSEGYICRFECLPAALPFLPQAVTPRPVIAGPQTATVVGPSGDEIFTDKYGRVKVQFNWDRVGKKDANSACWVRVGSFWAGKQWGGIHIPRIGHEVIVSFEDGDPDRPIIVGSVYNAENMPPYKLPDNATQSGIKSRTSKEGTEETFNELRFEDKKDNEQIYFHAEKNFDRVVENNDTLKVGFEKKDKGDQTIDIFNNQAVTVGIKDCDDGSQTTKVFNSQTVNIGTGKSDCKDGSQTVDVFNSQTLTVGSGKGDCKEGSQTISVYKDRTASLETGNESLTVKKGNRTVEVTEGDDTHNVAKGKRTVTVKDNDTLTVQSGNRSVTVSQGNDELTVSQGNLTVKVSAGKISMQAAQAIELTVGGSSIKIEPAAITLTAGPSSVKLEAAGVTVSGVQVKIQGNAQVQVQAPMTQVSGDGMLQLKGGVTMVG